MAHIWFQVNSGAIVSKMNDLSDMRQSLNKTATSFAVMRTLFLILLLALTVGVRAQSGEIFSTDDGAIRGYDPVAYFTTGVATKGKPEFELSMKGANWYFSSQANLEAFKAAPEKYIPQYGGYCAFGASDGEGHKAPTQPEAWTIVGGKLYFNYNKRVQSLWLTDTTSRIKQADINWPKIKGQ